MEIQSVTKRRPFVHLPYIDIRIGTRFIIINNKIKIKIIYIYE